VIKRIERSRMILACAWLLGFALYCPTLCIPPMVHLIRDEFRVTHEAVGILFSLPVIMLVALAIPGGLLADRIGSRKAVAIGAVAMAVGSLLRGISTSFGSLLAFTALQGVGYSIIYPNLPKLVSVWFPREKAGLATGVYATGITLGAAVPLAVTLPLIFPLFHTVRGTFFVWGLPAALGAAVWLIVARDPPGQVHSSQPVRGVTGLHPSHSLWRDKNIWLIALLLFLNNVHFFTWSAWTPSLLMMKGATPQLAALIASSRGWASLPTLFLMPWFSYKVGLKKPFMWGSAFLLAVASWAALYIPVPWGWPLMAAVGITTGGTFSMILALPLEMLPEESVGAASGMVLSIGYLGGIAGPWLAGRILDSTGSLDVALVVLIATALIWVVVGFLIPETGTRPLARVIQ
jgi:CP family cyanate transporter-like MFS transporter